MEPNKLMEDLKQAVILGDTNRAKELAETAIAAKLDPMTVVEQGIRPAMDFIGEGFSAGEFFLPDLVMGGEATKAAMAVLEPHLKAGQQGQQAIGRVVIGTVKGDIHEIGKTLVATLMRAAGLEVHDLGVDVPSDKFVDAVREFNADLLGLSALLTTTMTQQKNVIDALTAAGLRDKVKVMVGGAPVSASWSKEIGADAYADNAAGAARLAVDLLRGG